MWLILFFLSGATGLLYEVVWIRMLAVVLGAGIYSTAVVFAAFMLGLGLGNLAAPRLLNRVRDAARAYAIVELGIACGALAVPILLQLATPIYRSLHDAHLVTLVAVRFGLSFLITLVPTVFIGMTFPVMVKMFVGASRRVAASVGVLYAVNTAGAVCGTLLTAFVLLKYLGVYRTLAVAMACNVAIALVAFAVSRRAVAPVDAIDDAAAEALSPAAARAAPSRLILAAFFLSGFTALAYEVLWTRILTIYIAGSVLGLAVVLATFLGGLALGAVAFRALERKASAGVYGVLFWLIGVSSLFTLGIIPSVYQRVFDRFISIGGVVGLSVVLMLATTVLYGAAFPLGVALYSTNRRRVGEDISRLYFLNTLGGALGALCAGFVLVWWLGLHNSVLFVAFLNFELAALLLLGTRRRGATVLAVSGFVVLAAAALMPSTRRYISKAFAGGEYVYYREGKDATVAVMRDEYRGKPYHALLVDGQFVAGTQGAMEIDSKMLAHVPLLLHERPQTALTVGFGGGGTSFSMLEHPLERVDAVEIEPAVVGANQFFTDINFGVVQNPRLRIVFEDARNYLLLTERRYDVISTDVTNIRYRSNSSLYTRDYFELMRSRLNTGGIGAAWIPLSALTETDLRTLIATFRAVFPHTTLWYSPSRMDHFAVLVGTPGPLHIDLAALRPRFRAVAQDLARIRTDNAYEFLNMLMLDEAGVAAFVAGTAVHTDARPVLDFTTNAAIPADVMARNLAQVVGRRGFVGRYVSAGREDAALIQEYDTVARSLLQGHLAILQGRTADGERAYRDAYRLEAALRARVGSPPFADSAGPLW